MFGANDKGTPKKECPFRRIGEDHGSGEVDMSSGVAPACDSIGRCNHVRQSRVGFGIGLPNHPGSSCQIGDWVDENEASCDAVRGITVNSKRLDRLDLNYADVVEMRVAAARRSSVSTLSLYSMAVTCAWAVRLVCFSR